MAGIEDKDTFELLACLSSSTEHRSSQTLKSLQSQGLIQVKVLSNRELWNLRVLRLLKASPSIRQSLENPLASLHITTEKILTSI